MLSTVNTNIKTFSILANAEENMYMLNSKTFKTISVILSSYCDIM